MRRGWALDSAFWAARCPDFSDLPPGPLRPVHGPIRPDGFDYARRPNLRNLWKSSEKSYASERGRARGTSIAARSVRITMSDDSKPTRRGGAADGGAPLLDTVARRIEELSTAVVEQTERLLEKPTEASGADLAAILEAA